MVRIKICGIRSREEANYAWEAGAHAIGFVFVPKGRYIEPRKARTIIRALPPSLVKVGVFVNEPLVRVKQIAEYCGLDAVQLHGNEPPAYCRQLKTKVIKALRVKDVGVFRLINEYQVDAFLLDSFVPGLPGGTGQLWDWSLVKEMGACEKPIILSGGLTPDNVGKAIEQVRPYAVDVSSGVETEGKKDPDKITRFVKAVLRADG